MRISDWSSDVCSSDLPPPFLVPREPEKALRFSFPVAGPEHEIVVDLAEIVHQRPVVVDHGRLHLAAIADFAQPRFAPVGPGEDLAVLLRAEHRLAMLFRIEALAVEIADVAIVERAAAPLSEHELVGGRLEFGEQPLQRLIGCMLAIFDHSRELLVQDRKSTRLNSSTSSASRMPSSA